LPQADVLTAVLDVAQHVLVADGLAVWRLADGAWRTAACAGVSEAFATAAIATYRDAPAAPIDFVAPLLIEDVRTAPEVAERVPVYEREGIRSAAAIPLIVAGQATATLVLYYRTPHSFTEAETDTACALGRIVAAALNAHQRAEFLDRASVALGASLDLRTTAQTVADLAVPLFADSCAIHVPGPDGEVRLAAAAHVDASKRDAMLMLANRRQPNRDRGWGRTIVEGTVELFEEIDLPAVQQALRNDPAMMAAFAELQLVSQLSVPMRAHGRLVGALTFAFASGPRRYRRGDVTFAEDLARRCAVAIDNARLYEEAQRREAEAARAEERAMFLAEAGALVAGSLD
jgi:GAF domain-containing protein